MRKKGNRVRSWALEDAPVGNNSSSDEQSSEEEVAPVRVVRPQPSAPKPPPARAPPPKPRVTKTVQNLSPSEPEHSKTKVQARPKRAKAKPYRARSWRMEEKKGKAAGSSDEDSSDGEVQVAKKVVPRPPKVKAKQKPLKATVVEDDFDHSRQRYDQYGKKTGKGKAEVPMKSNNYLNRRMSEVLRGEDPDLADQNNFFFEDDHEELEKQAEAADTLFKKMELIYKTKMAEKKFTPRALLCVLGVSLLWVSSIASCKAIVNEFIPSPSYDDIKSSANSLSDFVQDQSESYEGCVIRETTSCRSVYLASRDVEIARVASVQESNEAILTSMSANRTRCANNYAIMIEKLVEYASVEGVQPSDFLIDDGDGTCDNIDALPDEQLAALQAVDASEAASGNATSTLTIYTEMLADRIGYDSEYLDDFNETFTTAMEELTGSAYNSSQFSDDLSGSLTTLQACLTSSIVNGTECANDFNDQIEDMFAVYLESFNDMNESLQEYVSNYEEQLALAQSLANRLDAVPDSLTDAIPALAFLDDEVDTDDLEELLSEEGLELLGLDTAEMEEIINDQLGNFLDEVAFAEAQLANLTAEINARQAEFFESVNANFTPPAENATLAESIDLAFENAGNLPDQIVADLAGLSLDSDEISDISTVESFANETATELIDGLANRTIDFFAYDDSIFTRVETNFDLALNLGLAFDTVWRVLQTLMLIKKYWSVSAIATPPGDIRSDKGSLFKDKKNPLQQLATLLSSQLVEMVYVILVVMILSLLFYVAYLPIFEKYVEGCVDNDEVSIREGEADGTMIFRNLLSVTTEFAESAGDTAISTGIDQLNLERQISCSDFFDASVDVRNEQNDTFIGIQAGMDLVNERYSIFDTCVDWAAYDVAVDGIDTVESVETVNNSAVPSFEQGFGDDTCVEVYLADALTFDDEILHACTSIAACITNCSGVDDEGMEEANHNTACISEFAMHSYFLIALFATTMFVCLNIARFYFMRGIISGFWPWFSLDVHTYLMSCTERGRILPPKRVEKGESFEVVIKEALDKSLSGFSRKGYFDITYAVLINLPWMIFMSIISQSINYEDVSQDL